MSWKDNPKFCILPFMVLNMRPHGTMKMCSQMSDMRSKDLGVFEGIPKTGTIDTYNSNLEHYNLNTDSIEEVWNSEFMQDFRRKKLNGEYIKHCEICYFDDNKGITSKRKSFIDEHYDEFEYLVKNAAENNGKMDFMPVWHEWRVSSICNSGCRMCFPQTSSFLRKEWSKNIKSLPSTQANNVIGAIKLYDDNGYLRDNPIFTKNLVKIGKEAKWIELHGGEPTADKRVWEMLDEITKSKSFNNNNIGLHMNTNCFSVKDYQIDIIRRFKKGSISLSIDAFGEENEYIRYPTPWSKIEENIVKFKGFPKDWNIKLHSTVMTYNAITMHRLLRWFSNYCEEHNIHDIFWRHDSIWVPEYLRMHLVPSKQRHDAAEKLQAILDENIWIVKESLLKERTIHDINLLILFLKRDDVEIKQEWHEKFVDYTNALDKIRNQNVLDVFPHLDILMKKD